VTLNARKGIIGPGRDHENKNPKSPEQVARERSEGNETSLPSWVGETARPVETLADSQKQNGAVDAVMSFTTGWGSKKGRTKYAFNCQERIVLSGKDH